MTLSIDADDNITITLEDDDEVVIEYDDADYCVEWNSNINVEEVA